MSNLFDVKDRVVIVTGGSGFLGAQFRSSLEKAGAVAENFDIDTGVNTTDEKSVQAAVALVLKKHGRIDGLVTSAAANPKADEEGSKEQWMPYSDFPADIFRKEVDINLTGSFLAAKAVSKPMTEARRGSIIFISSDQGVIGPANFLYPEGKFKSIAYGASKAGIFGLMRFFAAYLGPFNVRANALVPGGMFRQHDPEFAAKNGKLNMLGRMSNPGEYDGAVQFLLSDASSYMTGSSLTVDAGRTAW
ncbi:MAG: Short-chain dehydrogenase/reductase (SDR) superfamily [Parcubacteria group bacterium GW2011_GWA2_51_10]|nr:MAG: Short-chain dehydrogenase/reductase (SDR) superfamily [Parcubacteria group bacterium GW2011_GWA2_51_10]